MRLVTTKCPKCERTKKHLIGNAGFLGNEITRCSCGFSYNTAANTIGNAFEQDDGTLSNWRVLLRIDNN